MNVYDTFPLRAPSAGCDILVVAGEHSGDQQAARVVEELLAADPGLRIHAIGGPALAAAGATLLHDLTRRSVVGLVEVLRHYRYFRALMAATVAWIAAHQPRVVMLTDYPGFNLRLAQALRAHGVSRKGGGGVALYQYVSPQIWAWKAGRRFRMAQVLDELGAIFPFEPACYADCALPVHFVGHPYAAPGHQPLLRYDPAGDLLLLPGSRRQAVERIFPLLLRALTLLPESCRNLPVAACYPDAALRQLLVQLMARAGLPAGRVRLLPAGAGAAGRAVLTSSGTMSLACALAGIPGAIVYRAHPLTYHIGRRLVRVPYLGIANLILGEPVYPEFIQQAARPRCLARALATAADPARRAAAAATADRLREALRAPVGDSAAGRIRALLASPAPARA
jgi:lipid-A-disaccharide synthase